MQFFTRSCIATALLVLLNTSALAETTKWVTDDLSIMLRSGESGQHKIIRSLLSGTEVNPISENPETGYTLVRIPDGTEGYVLSRFLENHPAAKQKLVLALAQIDALSQSSEPAQLQLVEQRKTITNLEKSVSVLEAKNKTLSDQLEYLTSISGDAININEQYRRVLEKNQMLENEVNLQRDEIERLADTTNREWFMNGALAVLLGVIIAIIVPKIRRPKKHTEWI